MMDGALDNGKAQISINSRNYKEVYPILYNFLTVDQKSIVDSMNSLTEKTHTLSNFYSEYNPFIKIAGQQQDVIEFQSFDLKTVSETFGSKIGGFNVTTFADGLAQFMIERANEEVNVWFFRKFRKDLDKSIELRTIFPVTNGFIQITEPYQYAQNLHLLREAFKKDLSEIVDNLEDFANLEKYRRIFENSDELKVVLVGLAGASIVSKIKNGTHPADVIDSLGQKKYVSGVNNNLLSSLVLLSTLSQSLRSTEEGVAYISVADYKVNILSDNIAFRVYLGLLYQRLHDIKISSNTSTTTIGQILNNKKEDILHLPTLGIGLLERLNKIEENFEGLKAEEDEGDVNYLEWYDFYGSVVDLVEFGIDGSSLLPIKPGELYWAKTAESKKYIYSARLGNEIFRNVNEKNYSLAVLNFSVLYDTLIYKPIRRNQTWIDSFFNAQVEKIQKKDEIQKAGYLLKAIDANFSMNYNNTQLFFEDKPVDNFKELLIKYYRTENVDKAIEKFKKQTKDYGIASSRFIRYGAFMAAVADAEKPEDVKAALNAAALPAGSSSIKRQTPFNVSINSYLGFHIGEEKLEETGWGNIRGVSAPVGVAVSTHIKWPFKESGSISLFGSIIDIGAVASYRLTNDEGVETLPEMKLENIIAPGAYLIYGLPKAPISFGYGWQRGPQLRGITVTTPIGEEPPLASYDLANGYRWTFFIAVDIPLFNLYTKSK